jgi:hypothetical protein
MAGPDLVPVIGFTELTHEVSVAAVYEAVLDWLNQHTDTVGQVGPLILQEPDWWPAAQANCGNCGPGDNHVFDFVAIIPVAVCMGANMDITVARHQLWNGKWKVKFGWTEHSPAAANAIRVNSGDDDGYDAMAAASRIGYDLEKILG